MSTNKAVSVEYLKLVKQSCFHQYIIYQCFLGLIKTLPVSLCSFRSEALWFQDDNWHDFFHRPTANAYFFFFFDSPATLWDNIYFMNIRSYLMLFQSQTTCPQTTHKSFFWLPPKCQILSECFKFQPVCLAYMRFPAVWVHMETKLFSIGSWGRTNHWIC